MTWPCLPSLKGGHIVARRAWVVPAVGGAQRSKKTPKVAPKPKKARNQDKDKDEPTMQFLTQQVPAGQA